MDEKRYEYKAVYISEPDEDRCEWADGKQHNRITRILNELGHDGWKLTEVTSQDSSFWLYMFVREV